MVQTGTEGDRGISTIAANAAPTIADRIGTASTSLPGWRANRRPVAAGAGRTNIASRAQHGRRLGCKPLTAGHPLGRIANGEPDGGKSKADEDDPEPTAENGPVERDPRRRVEGPHRAERTERRKSNRHADGQQRPDGDGANDADERVGSEGRAGRHRVLAALPTPAYVGARYRPMTWTAIKSAARAVIPPKTPRAIESGLIARSAFPSSSARPWRSKPGGEAAG